MPRELLDRQEGGIKSSLRMLICYRKVMEKKPKLGASQLGLDLTISVVSESRLGGKATFSVSRKNFTYRSLEDEPKEGPYSPSKH